MAIIGLRKAKYNPIDTTTSKYKSLTGATVPVLGKIIDEKFSAEYNSAELYADDSLAESDYSFKLGNLSVTVANAEETTEATLMGHTVATDEVTKSITDKAPECGYGHIVQKQVNGVKKWKVEFFPRVRWTKITVDHKTRGEGVEFGTASIEGKVMPLSSVVNGMPVGTWEKHKTFDTEQAAEQYLDTCLTPSV